MPCSPRRSHHHCPGRGFRFHPYMMMHGRGMPMPPLPPWFMHMANAMEEEEDHPSVNNSNPFSKTSRWNESENDQYTFEMDVPGVLAPHVTVEEKDGEIEITAIRYDSSTGEVIKTYQDILYIAPSKSELAKARAKLVDGVLTIVIPKKKEEEPTPIAVESVDPPIETTVPELFRTFTVDLPGVHASDIALHVHQGRIRLQATRSMGEHTKRMRHVWDASDLPPTSVADARAYLQDGVLTVTIALVSHGGSDKEGGDDESTKPSAIRTIVVTSGEAEEEEEAEYDAAPLVAALQINDDHKDKDEEVMMVETVDDKEDWEEVIEDAKKKLAEGNKN